MILAKYFKLIFYLAICILGYSTGLYVGYKKLLNKIILVIQKKPKILYPKIAALRLP